MDNHKEMAESIRGTECEYGLLIQAAAGTEYYPPTDQDETRNSIRISYIPHVYHPESISALNEFYSNGSRFYVDVGSHIEYATPEERTIEGAIASEIAGERIVFRTLERAREKGHMHNFALNKRVIDYHGESWGYHESFSADARKVDITFQSLYLLGLHLATINLFTGSGAVVVNDEYPEPRFVIAQKSMDLTTDFDRGTTQTSKPLVNLRDESHANRKELVRVHVTSGDANMSPWAIRMRLGTISLVIKLIEDGCKFDRLGGTNPLTQIAKHVATDLTLRQTVKLDSGPSLRALNIQEFLIMKARDLAERVSLPEEEMGVLDLWEQAYTDLESDPALLMDRVDWVAKKRFIEEGLDLSGLDWSSELATKLDQRWGSISSKGQGLKLRKTLWSKWMPPEQLISRRETTPDQTTRAAVRSRFILKFAGIQKPKPRADWSYVKLDERMIKLDDPFEAVNKRVDRLVPPTKLTKLRIRGA